MKNKFEVPKPVRPSIELSEEETVVLDEALDAVEQACHKRKEEIQNIINSEFYSAMLRAKEQVTANFTDKVTEEGGISFEEKQKIILEGLRNLYSDIVK